MAQEPRNYSQASNAGLRSKFGSCILLVVIFVLSTGCSSSDSSSNPIAVNSNLKRGPYVQLGGEESISIIWQTYSDSRGAVEFGVTESLGTRIEGAQTGTEHSLSLTGLQANTYYYYRVLDNNRPLSKVARFHTNHAPDDTEFSFLVVGDSGEYGPPLFAVADLINSSEASFGLHTGDVIYPNGEERFYDSGFFFPYANFLTTNVMYPSLGNHDLGTDEGSAYFNNFYLPKNNIAGTERYYSFDYGHAHFIALDTNQSTEPGSAQLTWFEQDLGTSTKPWKFVFFHESPFSIGSFHVDGQRFDLANESVRQNLVPLFELYGVDIVFSGHSHRYERTFPILLGQPVDQEQEPAYLNPSGPIYVVTGGGGASLLGLSSNALNAKEIAAHHILEISLSEGELIGQAIEPPGVVIDEFRVVQW